MACPGWDTVRSARKNTVEIPMGDHVRMARIAAAATGVVLMAGLTACGSSDSAKGGGGDSNGKLSPVQAALTDLKQASKNTDAQHSAKVTGTQSQGTSRGQVTSKTKGVIDWSGGGTTADMTVTQGGSAVSGLPTAGKAMPARYTEDAMYINMGDSFASSVGKGKHWMKYDYTKLAKKAGASGALIKDQMQNNNPARSLDLLLAGGKVKKVGSEQVKGTRTDHYSGTLQVSELARMQSKNLSKKQLDQISQELKKQGLTTEKVDLWIDSRHLLVKKQERANGKNGKLNSSVFYSDYGTDVTVKAPAASDTLGFDDALGSVG